jgi:hypothetical protein
MDVVLGLSDKVARVEAKQSQSQSPDTSTTTYAQLKQAGADRDAVLVRFRIATCDLERYKARQFPDGTKVNVNSESYRGPGVAVDNDGVPPDKLAVRLDNGNTWCYPLECCVNAEEQKRP